MATMGRQKSETRFGRKLACWLSISVPAISNRCSKDSSCVHKGLMTNWPHHDSNMLQKLYMPLNFAPVCKTLSRDTHLKATNASRNAWPSQETPQRSTADGGRCVRPLHAN